LGVNPPFWENFLNFLGFLRKKSKPSSRKISGYAPDTVVITAPRPNLQQMEFIDQS